MAQGLRTAVTRPPDRGEQGLASNQLPGRSCEAHKHLYRLGRQVMSSGSPRYLTLERFHEEIAKIEAM